MPTPVEIESNMADRFKTEEFKEFKDFVMDYWRPATEAAILVTQDSAMYEWLNDWFSFLDDPTIEEIPSDCIVNVELYCGVYPYTKQKYNVNKEGVQCWEFLFLYDSIIKEKITAQQLTVGRRDFIDLWPKKGPVQRNSM